VIQLQTDGFCLRKTALLRAVRRVAGQLPIRGSVTVRIAADEEVRELNRTYRGQDRVTDVLSFPCSEKLPGGFYSGDILICWSVAQRQAQAAGHSLERELLLLTIHGLLHLHGLDHEKDQGQMLARQRRLFAEHAGELP
jgi:probable rRNA maturation factor